MRIHILSSICALGLGLASGAQAELLNISSNALQSQNTATAACAIVGAGGKTDPDGSKKFVILAEGKANDSDPMLTVTFSKGPVVTNDSWLELTYADGVPDPNPHYVENWLGRRAGRASDAGMVVFAYPGGWICASSREKSGGDTLRPVSISITDVTARSSNAKSLVLETPIDGAAHAVSDAPR